MGDREDSRRTFGRRDWQAADRGYGRGKPFKRGRLDSPRSPQHHGSRDFDRGPPGRGGFSSRGSVPPRRFPAGFGMPDRGPPERPPFGPAREGRAPFGREPWVGPPGGGGGRGGWDSRGPPRDMPPDHLEPRARFWRGGKRGGLSMRGGRGPPHLPPALLAAELEAGEVLAEDGLQPKSSGRKSGWDQQDPGLPFPPRVSRDRERNPPYRTGSLPGRDLPNGRPLHRSGSEQPATYHDALPGPPPPSHFSADRGAGRSPAASASPRGYDPGDHASDGWRGPSMSPFSDTPLPSEDPFDHPAAVSPQPLFNAADALPLPPPPSRGRGPEPASLQLPPPPPLAATADSPRFSTPATSLPPLPAAPTRTASPLLPVPENSSLVSQDAVNTVTTTTSDAGGEDRDISMADRLASTASTPASEDTAPKRRRLGWGQGLARLKPIDAQAAVAEGSSAAEPEAALDGPQAGAPADVDAPAREQQPQQMETDPPAAAAASLQPPSSHATPDALPDPSHSLPALLGHPTRSHPAAEPAAAAHQAGASQAAMEQPPASPLAPPAPVLPSKLDILTQMERVDADIVQLESQLAALSTDHQAMQRSEQQLKESLAELEQPIEVPSISLSSEEISDLSSSSTSEGSHPARDPSTAADMEVEAAEKLQKPSAEDLKRWKAASLTAAALAAEKRATSRRKAQYDMVRVQEYRKALAAHRAMLVTLPTALREQFGDGVSAAALYRRPEEADCYQRNLASHAAVQPRMLAALKQHRAEVHAKEVGLALRYRQLYELWKQRMLVKKEAAKSAGRGTTAERALARAGSRVGYARSEYEELQIVAQLQAVERMTTMVQIDSMLLDPRERRARAFISSNGRVLDPKAAKAEEDVTRPWLPEERRVFMDKFLLHPKDFHAIAEYLPHRSTADCIHFYYRTQKLDEFAAVRRKQQLKKRRLQTETKRNHHSYLGIAHAPPPQPLRAEPPPQSVRGSGRTGSDAAGRGTARARNRGGMAPRRGRAAATDSDPQSLSAGVALGDAAIDPNSAVWSIAEETLFLEALQQYGWDPKSVTRHMGSKTMAAVKKFFRYNKKRLGIDQLLDERAAAIVEDELAKEQEYEAQQAAEQQQPNPKQQDCHYPSRGPSPGPSSWRSPQQEHPSGLGPAAGGALQGGPAGGLLAAYGGQQEAGAGGEGPRPMDMDGGGDAYAAMLHQAMQAQMLAQMAASQGMHLAPQLMQHLPASAPIPTHIQQPGLMSLMGGGPGMLPHSPHQHPAAAQQQLAMQMALLQQPQLALMMQNPASVAQLMQNPQQLGLVMQMLQLQQAAAAGMGGLPGGLPGGMPGMPGMLPPNLSFGLLQAMAAGGGGGGGMNGGGHGPTAVPQQPQAMAEDEAGGWQLGGGDRQGSEHLGPQLGPDTGRRSLSYWSSEEKDSFMATYRTYGRDWQRLAEAVPGKTRTQIKNYYQNYKNKLGLDQINLPPTAVQPQSRKRSKPELDSPPDSRPHSPPLQDGAKDASTAALLALQQAANQLGGSSVTGNGCNPRQPPSRPASAPIADRASNAAGQYAGLSGNMGSGMPNGAAVEHEYGRQRAASAEPQAASEGGAAGGLRLFGQAVTIPARPASTPGILPSGGQAAAPRSAGGGGGLAPSLLGHAGSSSLGDMLRGPGGADFPAQGGSLFGRPPAEGHGGALPPWMAHLAAGGSQEEAALIMQACLQNTVPAEALTQHHPPLFSHMAGGPAAAFDQQGFAAALQRDGHPEAGAPQQAGTLQREGSGVEPQGRGPQRPPSRGTRIVTTGHGPKPRHWDGQPAAEGSMRQPGSRGGTPPLPPARPTASRTPTPPPRAPSPAARQLPGRRSPSPAARTAAHASPHLHTQPAVGVSGALGGEVGAGGQLPGAAPGDAPPFSEAWAATMRAALPNGGVPPSSPEAALQKALAEMAGMPSGPALSAGPPPAPSPVPAAVLSSEEEAQVGADPGQQSAQGSAAGKPQTEPAAGAGNGGTAADGLSGGSMVEGWPEGDAHGEAA